MRQVSTSYSLSLPYLLLACCILSCHYVHCIAYVFVSCIRAFSPLSVLQSDTPTSSGAPFCLFSCAGVKLSRNDRDFPSGLGIPPIDHLSSFVPFGVRLILQRLTGNRKDIVGVTLPSWSVLGSN